MKHMQIIVNTKNFSLKYWEILKYVYIREPAKSGGNSNKQ